VHVTCPGNLAALKLSLFITLHTYFPARDISRVRAPAPIGYTHCCHLTHWTKPWVTLVEQT